MSASDIDPKAPDAVKIALIAEMIVDALGDTSEGYDTSARLAYECFTVGRQSGFPLGTERAARAAG